MMNKIKYAIAFVWGAMYVMALQFVISGDTKYTNALGPVAFFLMVSTTLISYGVATYILERLSSK